MLGRDLDAVYAAAATRTWCLAGVTSSMSGTFYVNQSAPVNQNVRVDLTNVVITGDLTIIANTPVFTNGVSDSTSDAIFSLVSTYQPPTGSNCDVNQDKSECSVHLKNNFQPSGHTAVIVYGNHFLPGSEVIFDGACFGLTSLRRSHSQGDSRCGRPNKSRNPPMPILESGSSSAR